MSIENAVPYEVYNIMCADQERAEANLERIKSDLADAKALGDLSENATYDNLMIEKSTCSRQLRTNGEFLRTCEVLTEEELLEKYPLLFATITLTVMDVLHEITEQEEVVLTSNIDIRLKGAIRVVDTIGESLVRNYESKQARIIFKKENIIVEIANVVPYKTGCLVFSNE